jgi:5-methylcytosine-specific restriction endonuclease McrA
MKFRDRVQAVRVVTTARVSEKDILTPGAGSEDKKVRIEQKLLVQFLAGDELMRKFNEVKALLSASKPGISISEVLEVLVSEYLERHSPAARNERRVAGRRAASPVSQRRECNDAAPSRHIPNNVRDEVVTRDEGQCTYVAHDGTRCQSRHGLQIDHIQPFAAGGGHDLSNLRLLCAAHNKRAAERMLGASVMESYWRRQ